MDKVGEGGEQGRMVGKQLRLSKREEQTRMVRVSYGRVDGEETKCIQKGTRCSPASTLGNSNAPQAAIKRTSKGN
jgi:hypothetical protein